MTDPEWNRFEEEERKKFFNQQCPFPQYHSWCETKQYQSDRNMYQYVQARDKAQMAWNQSFAARQAEFERQLLHKKEKYLANIRLISSLRDENKRLQEKLQQLELVVGERNNLQQENQQLKEEILKIKTFIQSLNI